MLTKTEIAVTIEVTGKTSYCLLSSYYVPLMNGLLQSLPDPRKQSPLFPPLPRRQALIGAAILPSSLSSLGARPQSDPIAEFWLP